MIAQQQREGWADRDHGNARQVASKLDEPMLYGIARQHHDAVIGRQIAIEQMLSDCLRRTQCFAVGDGAPRSAAAEPLLHEGALRKSRSLVEEQVCYGTRL